MSKKCTPLWREAHFEVKMYKTLGVRTTFGSCDVEKVHAVVARSTFRSQNVQNTRGSDHFWQLRCRKKCTPLRCEAHFEVKMFKTLGVRSTFGSCDVEKVHAVVARRTFRNQNVKNTRVRTNLEVQMSLRFASLHYTPLHYITLHSTTRQLQLHNYTPLHSTPLHSTTLHYTTLHYTTLHSTTLHYTTLHYTTLPSTTLHYITLHYTPLHYNYNCTTTLHYTPLHYITLHYATFHYTSLHYTTLRYTPLHYKYNYNCTTTLHDTPLH